MTFVDNGAVTFEVDAGIAVVTINRPEARNSVNLAVAKGLATALDEVDTREDIKVGILTGAGGNFCSGMDLKAFLAGEIVRIEGKGFAGVTQVMSRKPWISAVEGYALAGGFELAIWCDLIVASEEARFGLPEVKRGLVANAGGLLRLPRQMPTRIATELVLTGDLVSAQRLNSYGLINCLSAPGEALQGAMTLAARIAANGPLAVSTSKLVMQLGSDWDQTEMFEQQNRLTAPVFVSEDAREGALAFAEKREPQWRGK